MHSSSDPPEDHWRLVGQPGLGLYKHWEFNQFLINVERTGAKDQKTKAESFGVQIGQRTRIQETEWRKYLRLRNPYFRPLERTVFEQLRKALRK